ncbi:hypothetical protein NC652_040451 [Populus alba x Populus x berolinensis]|nr:hypothetical protein NC652_040451 [Populus alba x Populus x berolinensis]
MVLAFVASLLATAELIYMSRKEIMSLLPCFHRPSTSTSAPGEPVGTIVEYFGLVGAVWQCFYSTVEYLYINSVIKCYFAFVHVTLLVPKEKLIFAQSLCLLTVAIRLPLPPNPGIQTSLTSDHLLLRTGFVHKK